MTLNTSWSDVFWPWSGGEADDRAGVACCGAAGGVAGQARFRSAVDCELSAAEAETGRGDAPAPDRGGMAP